MILYNHPISASGSIVPSGYSNDGHFAVRRDLLMEMVMLVSGWSQSAWAINLSFIARQQSQHLGASRWIDPLGLAPPSLSVIMPS